MLKGSVWKTMRKDNLPFSSGQERSHERNGYLGLFMTRNNDLAGLGNENSEQMMLLKEKFKDCSEREWVKGLSEVCVY